MNAAAADLIAAQEIGIAAGTRMLVTEASFAVRPGELWCVLGPNGSGKSSLLHVLAGLRAPHSGQVLLQAKPYTAYRPRAAARLRALLPQHQADPFESSVLETVMLGRHPHAGPFGRSTPEDRARADEAMRSMGVEGLAARDVRSLSGGERQRVALACALAQDASVLLLDEPTAHLDLSHQARLLHHLLALAGRGRGIVFATHDYNLAARFATHALLLTGSGPVVSGQSQQLLDAERLSAIFGFPLRRIGGDAAFVPRW